MRLHYLANARLPTEKAHGYQISQMCEAFAEAGADVTLLHADRHNAPELEGVSIWSYYGISRNFTCREMPCLDWYPLLRGLPRNLSRLLERFVSLLQLLSYTLALVTRLRPSNTDIFYSRDSVPLAAVVALRPKVRARLYYEAHEFPATAIGRWLRRWTVRRVAGVVVITRQLAKRYGEQFGLPDDRLHLAPDGVRLERFANVGDPTVCRTQLGLPQDAFIVGYVGQLHLMGMGKGVDTLVEALAKLAPQGDSLHVCIVGGPDAMVKNLHRHAASLGLPDGCLITPGRVHPDEVPLWMRAFDVCALPSPWNTFFAYYTSPLKLFEYMASGTPIVASDLPAFAEIVRHEESALLVPPGDADALAGALGRLRDDRALAERLSARASADVRQYTWRARAERLLASAEVPAQSALA